MEVVCRIHTMEGSLRKQGHLVKNWKERWFRLDGQLLKYYKRKSDTKPTGEKARLEAVCTRRVSLCCVCCVHMCTRALDSLVICSHPPPLCCVIIRLV